MSSKNSQLRNSYCLRSTVLILSALSCFSISSNAQDTDTERFFNEAVEALCEQPEKARTKRLMVYLNLASSLDALYRHVAKALSDPDDKTPPKEVFELELFSFTGTAYTHDFEPDSSWKDVAKAVETSEEILRRTIQLDGGANDIALVILVMAKVITDLTKYLAVDGKFKEALIEDRRLEMARFFLTSLATDPIEGPVIAEVSGINSAALSKHEDEKNEYYEKSHFAALSELSPVIFMSLGGFLTHQHPGFAASLLTAGVTLSYFIKLKYYKSLSDTEAAAIRENMSEDGGPDAEIVNLMTNDEIRRNYSIQYSLLKGYALIASGLGGFLINNHLIISALLSLSAGFAVMKTGQMSSVTTSSVFSAMNALEKGDERLDRNALSLLQDFLEAYADIFSDPIKLQFLFDKLDITPNTGMGAKLLAFAWGYFTQIENLAAVKSIERFSGETNQQWPLPEGSHWRQELSKRSVAFVDALAESPNSLWNANPPVTDGAFDSFKFGPEHIATLATPLGLNAMMNGKNDGCANILAGSIRRLMIAKCQAPKGH